MLSKSLPITNQACHLHVETTFPLFLSPTICIEISIKWKQGKEGNKTIQRKKFWPKNTTKKGNFLIITVNQLDNLLKLVPVMNSWIPTPRLLPTPISKYNARERRHQCTVHHKLKTRKMMASTMKMYSARKTRQRCCVHAMNYSLVNHSSLY